MTIRVLLAFLFLLPSLALAQDAVPQSDPWDAFFRLVYPALAALLVALLGWLTVWVQRQIKENVKSKTLGRLLSTVAGLADRVVSETNQVFVDALKENAADGKLTPAERQEAARRAIEKLKSYLSVDTLVELGAAFGPENVDGVLATHVEAAVADMGTVADPT